MLSLKYADFEISLLSSSVQEVVIKSDPPQHRIELVVAQTIDALPEEGKLEIMLNDETCGIQACLQKQERYGRTTRLVFKTKLHKTGLKQC